MAKKKTGFTIREADLAKALEITREKLDEIVTFFDADPSDQWELRENEHFVYLNRNLGERLFSEQGAYAVAKYLDEKTPKSIWASIREFLTGHKEKIRNAFINRKINENCSSLTTKNRRHFLSKKDVVNILCTSPARLNKAFEDIQRSNDPMKIYEDFDEMNGSRYYSLSGFYKLSQNLAQTLTVKDRKSWCGAIEVVGKKTFKHIIDVETARQKKIDSAKQAVKRRDKCCQITGKSREKYSKTTNLAVHHLYSKEHYPHLEACQDNLITLTEEVHREFHAWNGGFQNPCTVDHLIQFVTELHPESYEVLVRLNRARQILDPQSSKAA